MPDDLIFKPGDKIVFLGDSITEDPNGYATVTEQLLLASFPEHELSFINAGSGGHKANDMAARLGKDVLQHEPQWVTLSVGVNDVWHGWYDFDRGRPRDTFDPQRGLPIDTFAELLDQMVEEIQAADAEVVLISPTVIGDDPHSRENRMLGDYVQAMHTVATKYGCHYCPMNESYWSTLERAPAGFKMTTDGVHMNAIGANMMAVALLRTLGYFNAMGSKL